MGFLRNWLGRAVLGIFLGAFATAPALAAGKNSEVLFVYPPEGWRLGFHTEIGDIRFFEYVPAGQTVDEWSDMISVQIIKNKQDLSPGDVARGLRTRFIAACGSVQHRGPERLKIGGYLGARLYLECANPVITKRPGGARFRRFEVAAFQIIQGQNDIYVIERAWHGDRRADPGAPYGRDDLWGWDAFLYNIEVCDAERRHQACFGLGLLTPEKADIFASKIDPVLPYGCDYFRMMTLLPDLSRPAKPTLVVPVKLARTPFGKTKQELAFVDDLLTAYNENRPATVILTIGKKALAGQYRTDYAKATRDAYTLRALLTASGVAGERIHEVVNPSCSQS